MSVLLDWVQRESQFNIPLDLKLDGINYWALLGLTMCGPTCVSMVTAAYNQLNPDWQYLGPKEAVETVGFVTYGDPHDHVVLGYGVTGLTMVRMAQPADYLVRYQTNTTPDQIVQLLEAQIPVILLVGPKDRERHRLEWFRNGPHPFPYISGEHCVVCYGMYEEESTGQRIFRVHDPLNIRRQTYSEDELRTAMWIDVEEAGRVHKLLFGQVVIIYPRESSQHNNLERLLHEWSSSPIYPGVPHC